MSKPAPPGTEVTGLRQRSPSRAEHEAGGQRGFAGRSTETFTPLLVVEDLRCLFPVRRGLSDVVARRHHNVHAVDAVSFTLDAGEILALVGESGCGKSTTGRLLVHLVDPTSGTIRFAGEDVTHLSNDGLKAFRRRAQIIFQNPFEIFDPRLTIESSLTQALAIH